MITVIHVTEYGDAINFSSWEQNQLSTDEVRALPESVALKYLIIVDESDLHRISETDKLIVLNHTTRTLSTFKPVRPKPQWTVKGT